MSTTHKNSKSIPVTSLEAYRIVRCRGSLYMDRLCGSAVRVPGYRSKSSGLDSRRYHIFWGAVGLERGPLNLVGTVEELLGRKSSGSGPETREYRRRDPSRWSRGTLYPQKLAVISPTSGGRSVGIVRLRTRATEFYWYIYIYIYIWLWFKEMWEGRNQFEKADFSVCPIWGPRHEVRGSTAVASGALALAVNGHEWSAHWRSWS
jgi:hypothetical protein